MKKYLLLIALFAGCNFAFTSCSDDDDNADEIDTESAFSEEAMAAYCALNELCDIEELPANWQTYTAEPTIGYAVDASNPYVRTVYIDDIMEAEDCFRSLGGEIESGQASATYTAGSISYVYTAKNQSDLLATIDCNVPQVPHLTQIRFVPGDAQDDNGLFGFSWAKDKSQDDIYYRLGDVIEYEGAYWVCVRPAIYGEKHKTYWVAIYANGGSKNEKLFSDCFYTLSETSKYGEHIVPTKLGTDVTSFKHFAILLNALSNNTRYGDKAKEYGFGVGGEMICNNQNHVVDNTYFEHLKKVWKTGEDGENYNVYSKLGLAYEYIDEKTKDYMEYARRGFLIFYKGYSSWGKTMTLWALHSTYHKADEPIDPYKDFEDLKFNWELSEVQPKIDELIYESGQTYNIKNYLNWGWYMKNDSGIDAEKLAKLYGLAYQAEGTREDKNEKDTSVTHGFLIKDKCFTGSPYEAIPKATDLVHFKDYIDEHPEVFN